MFPDLHIEHVHAAREAIRGLAVETPLVRDEALSRSVGGDVWLKLETLQPTGAFKVRGAANAVAQLDARRRRRGVVCASTGNHGRAVAWAAARAGVAATVCLSSLVPENKVQAVQAQGARVVRIGDSQDAAGEEVTRLVAREGLTEIPPFDHAPVIAGQGTLGLEILEQCPGVASVLVPLSGGGLLGGVALALRSQRRDVRITGISMRRGAAMHASLKAGHPVEVTESASLADSLGGGIGLHNRYTFALCGALMDRSMLLDEVWIYRGMRHLFDHHGLVVEGAGAVAAAALLAGTVTVKAPVVLVVSGRNVDGRMFLDLAGGRPVTVGEEEVGP